MKLENLSDAQLVAENQELMREREALRKRQLDIKRELDERDARRRAEGLLEGMSDDQVQAVAAVAAATKKES